MQRNGMEWMVVAAACGVLALGCGGRDVELPEGTVVDAGAGESPDGGTAPQAGGDLADAGPQPPGDAGATPPGSSDAGLPGTGTSDAGLPGTGTADAGVPSGAQAAAGTDTCGGAPLLGPGTWQVDTTGAAGDVSQWEGVCGVASTASGPDRFFTLDVPAGSLVRASLQAGSFSGARLALFRDCAAPTSTCERLGSQAVAWANTDSTARPLLLAVDGFLGAQSGVAQVKVELEPLSQQPAGATCAAAIPLAVPGSVTGTTTGRDDLVDGYVGPGGECLRYGNLPGMGAGGDVTYAVQVPAGKTLSVAATASGGWDLVVAILGDCGAASSACSAWSDPGTAQVTNASGAVRTYFVVVDGFHPYSHGDFTLTASVN